ncbi:MAG: ATP-binding protein [Pseudomonadota bacterium]
MTGQSIRSQSAADLIGLSADPVALFDENAVLVAVNASFSDAFRAIGGFLRPGTPWGMLLTEIERRALFPAPACQALRLIEERLIGRDDAHPAVEGMLTGAGAFAAELSSLSDSGFALCLRPLDRAFDGEDAEVEQLMAKVLEACPASLTMARIGDGRVLYRSPAATELLGKGRDSVAHFAHRAERADFVTALLPDARVDDMRVTGRRADGSGFPASISARLIDYRGEEVVVSTMVDLSDDLALQDALARQKEQVFQAEKMSALGELLAGVAHELNNPLSIVVGNAHILQEEDLDEVALRRVEKLSAAAERCVRIVRTFLSMARDRPLDLEAVAVVDLIGTAVDAFQAGETDDVNIAVDVEPDLPDLLIDEVQIVQVLTNLLTNAQHAMADAVCKVTMGATRGPAAGLVRLRVSDNGPGVPEGIAGRIFDPLFTTKSVGKGTGVGLALCQRIVVAHGGTIKLDRDVTTGASFVVDLPTAADP